MLHRCWREQNDMPQLRELSYASGAVVRSMYMRTHPEQCCLRRVLAAKASMQALFATSSIESRLHWRAGPWMVYNGLIDLRSRVSECRSAWRSYHRSSTDSTPTLPDVKQRDNTEQRAHASLSDMRSAW